MDEEIRGFIVLNLSYDNDGRRKPIKNQIEGTDFLFLFLTWFNGKSHCPRIIHSFQFKHPFSKSNDVKMLNVDFVSFHITWMGLKMRDKALTYIHKQTLSIFNMSRIWNHIGVNVINSKLLNLIWTTELASFHSKP